MQNHKKTKKWRPGWRPRRLWVNRVLGYAKDVKERESGSRWVQVDKGSLPFALSTRFRGGPGTVNPLGKAIKFFADGAGGSVASVVRVTRANP